MKRRYNPFTEMERLFERMARQFADASEAWEADESFGSLVLGPAQMRVDVADRGEEFVATADLPGFERKEVEVYLSDETLHIEAEREESLEESDAQYVRKEREQRKIHRSIALPEPVDEDGVQATMKSGVLTVKLPKLSIAEAKHIEISAP